MDLSANMYVAWGSSMKSEKDAFKKVIQLLKASDAELKSVRLERRRLEGKLNRRMAQLYRTLASHLIKKTLVSWRFSDLPRLPV